MDIETIVILDRSGSMEGCKSDALGGMNEFLNTQKRDTPDGKITLVQFNDQYEVSYQGKRAAEVPLLDEDSFVPRGTTALYDAIGRTLSEVGSRTVEEYQQKVIVAILTDGLENASTKYKSKQIQDMIKECQSKGWSFLFLAANQDAIATGECIGITKNMCVSNDQTNAGYHAVGNTMSAVVKMYAGGQQVNTVNWQKYYNAKEKNLRK